MSCGGKKYVLNTTNKTAVGVFFSTFWTTPDNNTWTSEHKSHTAPFPYPTMHHFVTVICTFSHFCYKMMHFGIFVRCIVGFGRWITCCTNPTHIPCHNIRRHRYGSTLAQVMAFCLKAPSHYLTNVDSPLVRFCGIHLRAISHRMHKLLVCIRSLKSMMTSSNGNIFRVTGPLCGEFTGPGEFPAQRPVTRSFDVYFDLRPN